MKTAPVRLAVILMPLLLSGAASICIADEPPPPIHGALLYGATELHTHIPPGYSERTPCIIDWYWNTEVTGLRYQAWMYGKFLQDYRIGALMKHSGVEDLDWRADWDSQYECYGEPYPIVDWTSIIDTNTWYKWNGGAWQSPYYSPTTTGTIDFAVRWYDDNVPEGSQDVAKWDTNQIEVRNNIFSGNSLLAAPNSGLYLSALRVLDSPPHTTTPYYDYGYVHYPVRSSFSIYQYRHARSYNLDPRTATDTDTLLAEYYEGPVFDAFALSDPGGGRRYFVSTAQPRYDPYAVDHTGIPFMLKPKDNAMMHGGVCVVRGTVTISGTIPRKPGDPPVTISWNIQPSQTVLAPGSESVIIEVWDPTWHYFEYAKEWAVSGLSGSFQWSGLLDEYDELGWINEYDVKYCEASTLFACIRVKVRDAGWLYAPIIQDNWYTFNMPRLAIVPPVYNKWFLPNDRIALTAVKSASVTESLSLVQWSGGGVPATGTGASFATSYSTPNIYNITAQIPGSQAQAAQTRVGVMTCNFSYPNPGSNPPMNVGFTISPAGAPLNPDLSASPSVVLIARDPIQHTTGFSRNLNANAESGTFSWDGLYYDDGYPPGTTATQSLKDVFLSLRVRLKSGWEAYEYTIDGFRVAVGSDLGTYYNETVTSSIALMTAYPWPTNWGGTTRTLQWNFLSQNQAHASALSTTFTIPTDAVHTLAAPLTCIWNEYSSTGQLIRQVTGTQPLRVLFDRYAGTDPDAGNTSGVAWCNWFKHYASDPIHMAAVPGYYCETHHVQDNTTVTWIFDPQGTSCYCDGWPTWTTATVVLSSAYVAGDTHQDWPLTTQTQTWVSSTGTTTTYTILPHTIDYATTFGVDTMTWAVAHENEHVRQFGNWHRPNGQWYVRYLDWSPGPGGNDFDSDIFPDEYEDSIPTNWRAMDTWTTFYHRWGQNSDFEYDAELRAQSHTVGNRNQDFGRPGYHSVPQD